MQNLNQIAQVELGVTQIGGVTLKQNIRAGGLDWRLRRDATDASSSFPHPNVNWINAGCEPLGNTGAYYCWIMGIILPTGALQKPLQVMYIGFHNQRITVMPHTITTADLERMHVYISDGVNFAQDFVEGFLDIGKAAEEREAIQSFPPPMLDASILETAKQSKKPEAAPAAVVKPTLTAEEVLSKGGDM